MAYVPGADIYQLERGGEVGSQPPEEGVAAQVTVAQMAVGAEVVQETPRLGGWRAVAAALLQTDIRR